VIADRADGILYGGVKMAFSTKINRGSMAGFHSTYDGFLIWDFFLIFLGCSGVFISFFLFFINGAARVPSTSSCVL